MHQHHPCATSVRCLWLVLVVAGLSPAPAHAQPSADFTPVTDAMLADPSPDDWLMWRRTLDGWGYRPLDPVSGSIFG